MSAYSKSSKKYNIDCIVKNVVELMAVEKSKRDYNKIIDNIIKMEELSDFMLFNLSLILNKAGIDFTDLCKEIAPYMSIEQRKILGKVFSNFDAIVE